MSGIQETQAERGTKMLHNNVFSSGDQATFVASRSSFLQKYPNVANPHLLQH